MVRLDSYEKAALRRLFRVGRRAMWLSDLPSRRTALNRVYKRLEREAREVIRENPSLPHQVRDFEDKLRGVKPKSLDHWTRRDYLPYVLGYSLVDEWDAWGVRPPSRLPNTVFSPPGRRRKPGPGGEVEHQLPVVADVLHGAVNPVFEDIERRERDRVARSYHEWNDPPF
ncbi:hypothetical protein ACFQ1S_16775 [Kibdelosporangium lantanae]|uniref:Uncharacterized protein n=1 Tax=Kibdelosporangium lantanae TaxID=1497396 RepID=A0ABW3MAQ1_9PSEU